MIPLNKPETTAQANRFQWELDRAIEQGFCYPCAVDTAYWMQHGLHYLGPLCKDCERRLNPQPQENRRTGKWVLVLCEACQRPFTPLRKTARFCGDVCRKAGQRAKNRGRNP